MIIEGLLLVETCGACPEQYDVLDQEDNKVGYLRLRHGSFTAEYPGSGGELVYEALTEGDGLFEDHERLTHLTAAIRAIRSKLGPETPDTLDGVHSSFDVSETYIGDGLYASFDGYQIWLRAPRIDGDHRVAMEPAVFDSLMDFSKKVWPDRS